MVPPNFRKLPMRVQIQVPDMRSTVDQALSCSYSFHCSSLFWFSQFYIKDPKRQPKKATTMETAGLF